MVIRFDRKILRLTLAETKLERQWPSRFELIAGNVCLDFINTLDDRPSGEPKELLKDYDDLARFGEEAGILTPAQFDDLVEKARAIPDEARDEAEEALRRARNLREALHDIFSALMNHEAAPQPAMDTLNANLHDAALHSRLIQREMIQSKTIQREPRCEWRFNDLTSEFQRNALADCPRGRRSARLRRFATGARLLLAHLPVVFSRHQQKSSSSLVRHEVLWQSRQGSQVLR